MLYVKDINIPAKTPADNPVEAEVEIEEKVIVLFQVYFPPGCCGLAKVSFWYGDEMISPKHDYQWIHGDSALITDIRFWTAPEKPCTITIKGYNEDDTYPHTPICYILALPEEIALSFVKLAKLYDIVVKLAELVM